MKQALYFLFDIAVSTDARTNYAVGGGAIAPKDGNPPDPFHLMNHLFFCPN